MHYIYIFLLENEYVSFLLWVSFIKKYIYEYMIPLYQLKQWQLINGVNMIVCWSQD